MKPVILALLLLTLFQQPTDVRVGNDKFEDRTGVMMFQVPLGRGDLDWLPSPNGINDPDQLHLDELVDEVQHRMDQVVEAAVEWHQAGREGAEWFEAAERLGAAIDSLLELRGDPARAQ